MSEFVNKSGEEWLRISLLSHKRGLMISVKVHPLVEEFMSGLAGGKSIPLMEAGQHQWEPIDDTQPLSYYQFVNPVRNDGRGTYYISGGIGTNIVNADDQINLSFLALTGIGTTLISFLSTKEVYPLNFRRELKVRIANAFRDFVREYIRPVKITLVMTSQEL